MNGTYLIQTHGGNMSKVVVYLGEGKGWDEAKFEEGDKVVHEEEPGIITSVTVNPFIEYIFSYTMFPTHRGGDIPEDEIDLYYET